MRLNLHFERPSSSLFQRIPSISPIKLFVYLSLLHLLIQTTIQSIAFARANVAIPVLREIEEAPLLKSDVIQITDPSDIQSYLNSRSSNSSDSQNLNSNATTTTTNFLIKRDRAQEDALRGELFSGSLNDTYAILNWKDEGGRGQLVITRLCSIALISPIRTLRRVQRQLFTFLFFQLWIWGASVVAVLYGSVPHLASVLAMHFLSFAYAIYQLAQVKGFHDEFHHEVLKKACAAMSFQPSYLRDLLALTEGFLVIEGIFLLFFVIVAIRAWGVLDWSTWHKIGGDRRQSTLNKAVLSLKINLQVSMFFILSTFGIYISLLSEKGNSIPRADNELFLITLGYKEIAILSVAAGLFVPWLFLAFWVVGGPKKILSETGKQVMKWTGVEFVKKWMKGRKWIEDDEEILVISTSPEKKKGNGNPRRFGMSVFFVLGAGYIIVFLYLLTIDIFPREPWGFLTFMDVASLLIVLGTLGSAIACVVLSTESFWDHGMDSASNDEKSIEEAWRRDSMSSRIFEKVAID